MMKTNKTMIQGNQCWPQFSPNLLQELNKIKIDAPLEPIKECEGRTSVPNQTHHGNVHMNAVRNLFLFQLQMNVVEKLGWFEHTCDWDLYLSFKFKDDTTFDSEYGYSNFNFSLDGIKPIEIREMETSIDYETTAIKYIIMETNDHKVKSISIDNISTITLCS